MRHGDIVSLSVRHNQNLIPKFDQDADILITGSLASPIQLKKSTSAAMSPTRAAEVAQEAKKLANSLSDIVSELQRRREEAAVSLARSSSLTN